MSEMSSRISAYVDVYYHTEHGSAPDSNMVSSGSSLDSSYFPVLIAEGYVHVGWYTTPTFDEGTEASAGFVVPNYDSHFYAKWVDEVVVSVSSLQGIGNAIRAKNGTATQYKPGEMEAAIEAISSAEDLAAELTEYENLNTELESIINSLPDASSGSSVVTDTVTIPAFDSITIECENPQYAVVGSSINAIIVGVGETVSGSGNNLTASLTSTSLTITNEVSISARDVKYYIFSEGGSSGGGGKKTVTVTVTGNYATHCYYMDENGTEYAISAQGQTVEALSGVITKFQNSVSNFICTEGSAYIFTTGSSRDCIICLEDGTVIDCAYSEGGGSN